MTEHAAAARSNIIKIGDSEIEVKTKKGGERNYIAISESSSVVLEFPTSVGKLNIILYHDVKNCHQVQVRMGNQEMWAELMHDDKKMFRFMFTV